MVETTANRPSCFVKERISKGQRGEFYSALKVKPERQHDAVKREQMLESDGPGWNPDSAFIYQFYLTSFYTALITSEALFSARALSVVVDGSLSSTRAL